MLIDTYDTIAAAKKIVKSGIKDRINAVRLDSGDLYDLSMGIRKIFDEAGLKHIKILILWLIFIVIPYYFVILTTD